MEPTKTSLSWSAVGLATGYDIEYREAGASSWSFRNLSTTSTSISTTLGKSYEWKVRAKCGTTQMSGWSPVQSFTASYYCSAPTNVYIANVRSDRVTVGWDFDEEKKLKYRYRVQGTSTWANSTGVGGIGTSAGSYTVIGLVSGNAYEMQLAHRCGGVSGMDSDWSPSVFVTLPNNIDSGLEESAQIGKGIFGESNLIQFSRIENVRIYPNPFASELKIDFTHCQWEKTLTIGLRNLNGALIARYELQEYQPEMILRPELLPGIYILEFLSADGVLHHEKVVRY
ncbi:MAG: hypothetical protein IPI11_12305 [Haliscomenobacter sp.]|nr:hypothetical protein [Haliscomenobacter sp.]